MQKRTRNNIPRIKRRLCIEAVSNSFLNSHKYLVGSKNLYLKNYKEANSSEKKELLYDFMSEIEDKFSEFFTNIPSNDRKLISIYNCYEEIIEYLTIQSNFKPGDIVNINISSYYPEELFDLLNSNKNEKILLSIGKLSKYKNMKIIDVFGSFVKLMFEDGHISEYLTSSRFIKNKEKEETMSGELITSSQEEKRTEVMKLIEKNSHKFKGYSLPLRSYFQGQMVYNIKSKDKYKILFNSIDGNNDRILYCELVSRKNVILPFGTGEKQRFKESEVRPNILNIDFVPRNFTEVKLVNVGEYVKVHHESASDIMRLNGWGIESVLTEEEHQMYHIYKHFMITSVFKVIDIDSQENIFLEIVKSNLTKFAKLDALVFKAVSSQLNGFIIHKDVSAKNKNEEDEMGKNKRYKEEIAYDRSKGPYSLDYLLNKLVKCNVDLAHGIRKDDAGIISAIDNTLGRITVRFKKSKGSNSLLDFRTSVGEEKWLDISGDLIFSDEDEYEEVKNIKDETKEVEHANIEK